MQRTQYNLPQCCETYPNQAQLNQAQLNQAQLNQAQFNQAQLNQTQPNSTKPNLPQPNPTQLTPNQPQAPPAHNHKNKKGGQSHGNTPRSSLRWWQGIPGAD